MTAESATRTLIASTMRDFQSSWKSLMLTGLAYRILAFIALTPLVGLLFRVAIATSGDAVLTDTDILHFLLGPLGWCGLIGAGALWLGILALEQASLIAIVYGRTTRQRIGVFAALRFAFAHAWPVIQVTARMVAWTLLLTAPFLGVAALAYGALLGEHDINYYLTEKPPVFRVALGIGGIMLLALVAILLRQFASWFFALPLVLFEGIRPGIALRSSRERALGHRRTLLGWIVCWTLATTALSALVTSLVGLVGRLLIPSLVGSLPLLAVAIGVATICWAALGLVVQLLSTMSFAVILFNLHRQIACAGNVGAAPFKLAERFEDDGRFHLSRRHVIPGAIVGIVVAGGIGVLTLSSVRLDDDVKIMAHRGSSHVAPENTMAAITQAIEDGADWVEIDVQETADGEVVVFHDSDLMKLAGRNLKIWDATLADLSDIDIGSRFAPKFKDERVPTLAQVLKACKGKIGVNIELKYYGHDQQLEERVAHLVDAHEMAAEVVAMSLKREGVRKMKALRPTWKVGLLMSVAAGNVKKIDADFLAVNATFAGTSFIKSAHKQGKEVYVWTVNDAPTMSIMIGRGVDALLTDKPALARSVLKQRAELSTPERLLLELAGTLGVKSEIGEP